MSNAGRWDAHYANVRERTPYADTETYRLGAEWLAECDLVADWGCGLGWLRNFVDGERYLGLDGSASDFADQVVDLAEHRADYAGVFMRHVIEHCHDWPKVLDNALASFTERMSLILFTPLVEDETRNLGDEPGYPGVPCYSFKLDDLLERFKVAGVKPVTVEQLRTSAARGNMETIFYLEKP